MQGRILKGYAANGATKNQSKECMMCNRKSVTKGCMAVVLAVFLFCSCSKQTPSSGGQPNTGSINLSSEVAGMVLIDGAETGKRVKAQGTILIENVDTGMTETAVLLDDGTMVKAQEMALVKAGETVEVHIAVTAVVPPETPTQTTKAEPPKQETKSAPQPDTSDKGKALNKVISGLACLLVDDYDGAITLFSEAIQLQPDYADAYYNRGKAFSGKRNYSQAIADYSAALRIQPANPDALYERGFTYYDMHDYDKAIADYTAALRIKPDYYQALYYRGIAYGKKGNFDNAIADHTAALRIKPDYYPALYNRGAVYFNNRDYDRAIADWTAALRIKPDLLEALYYRGVAYANKGDLDRAIADFEAVLRIEPNHAGAKELIEMARKERGY